ncbi:MAG: sigma-54-dependent Fis family transcriptional regulator [Verrucomicrobia bacterium]|nr:MAG: sigma-54-dependent Fis family transcriptional regulator [Verrucomicrobiota bacterium]
MNTLSVSNQTVLIVDSETDFLDWARLQLKASGVKVITETNATNAFKIFCLEKPDLVITEMHLRPAGGLDLLAKIRAESSNAMVIIMSAFGTTQAVIESMKLGAFDFLRKESLPFTMKVVVDSALKAAAELRSASPTKPALTVEQYRDDIVGQSEAMQSVFKMVGRVAMSDAPVLVTGESGSGKELVARAIHNYSERSKKSLLAINCAAIPENLLESELFGHEKGSFTGAATQRIGRFEQCSGGTLFLDEIGEMPLAVQSKLLRVLQEGEFSRVGGNATIKANVRIVAATNRNLEQAIVAKEFREDLYYRLNVVGIHLPPLRARVEDIRLLAEYFLSRIANSQHRPLLQLSAETIKIMEAYPWPGNVRELQNTLQRACVLATSDVLLPKDLPLGQVSIVQEIPELAASTYTDLTVEEAATALFKALVREGDDRELLPWVEEDFTRRAMDLTKRNQVKAAKMLGITRATLRKRLERLSSITSQK